MSCFAPQTRGFLDQPCLGAVTSQQFGLVLSDFGEMIFKRFGDASVKGASRLAQQGSVGRILHQSVFEQISGMWRHALPKQQTGSMRRSSADWSSASGLRATAASSA